MTFQELGINTKGFTSGQHKVTCPKCSDERKKKNDPCLSINFQDGTYYCHHCQWSGSLKESKKNYTVPDYNNTPLSDYFLNWFINDRKISKSTVLRFGITQSKTFLSGAGKEVECINFNYKRDGKLINIKFRDKDKNFGLSKGAELIPFNIDSIADTEEAVITEGEIDAMSFYEAGIFNVISVPAGAKQGKQNLDWLNSHYDYFKDKKKIFIATDSDSPGITLGNELARRLGKERCFKVDFKALYGTKDANEVLQQKNKEVLLESLKRAIPYPIEGIDTVESLNSEIDDFFENGFPEGCTTGLRELDELISYYPGLMTTITGIPGSGKTELLNYTQMQLALNHGWKFALFSPENPSKIHFKKYAELYTGKAWRIINSEYQMSKGELENAKAFINDHFYWIRPNDNDLTIDGLLSKCKELICRYGINSFTVDPWNYLDHKIPYGYTETQYISEALTKFKRFCEINQIHMFIVAHPTKIQKEDGKYKVPTLYDIAGSAHFFNKTDNGITVYRDFETNVTTTYIQKIRFNWMGKMGAVELFRNPYNNRYSKN